MILELPGAKGRYGRVWVDELPPWPELGGPALTTYWQRPPAPPAPPAPTTPTTPADGERRGGFAFSVRFDGRRLAAGLAATFTPWAQPVLAVEVRGGGAEASAPAAPATPPLASVGGWAAELQPQTAGGVLVGSTQEPWRLGPGSLQVRWAVGRDDSNWDAFRIAALGLVRLLATPPHESVAAVLPFFGGDAPGAPGGDPRTAARVSG